MNEPMEDAEFEAYIGRRSRLSHRYRDLTGESPPKELDEAVMSLARAAHSLQRPAANEREVYIGWMAPVAFAATVVLVFTVVLQIVIRPQLAGTSVAESDRPSTAAAAPAEQFALERKKPADPARRDEAPSRAGSVEHRVASDSASTPTAITALDDVKAVTPQPAPDTTSLITVTGERQPETKLAKDTEAIAMSPPPAVSARSNTASRERMSGATAKAESEQSKRDPRAWLEEIEQLRRNGQTAAADDEMKLFLAQYPDYIRTHSPPADSR